MDETFRNLIIFLITVITGIVGVPIIQWLKNQFGWTDRPALILTMIVAFVLGAIEIVLSGQVDFGNLVFEDLPVAFTIIFTAATVYYKLFKGTEGILGKKLLVPYSRKDLVREPPK